MESPGKAVFMAVFNSVALVTFTVLLGALPTAWYLDIPKVE
jgi:hypothetical protein